MTVWCALPQVKDEQICVLVTRIVSPPEPPSTTIAFAESHGLPVSFTWTSIGRDAELSNPTRLKTSLPPWPSMYTVPSVS